MITQRRPEQPNVPEILSTTCVILTSATARFGRFDFMMLLGGLVVGVMTFSHLNIKSLFIIY